MFSRRCPRSETSNVLYFTTFVAQFLLADGDPTSSDNLIIMSVSHREYTSHAFHTFWDLLLLFRKLFATGQTQQPATINSATTHAFAWHSQHKKVYNT